MAVRNVLLTLHIATAILVLGPLLAYDLVTPVLVGRGRSSVPTLRFVQSLTRALGPGVGVVFLLGVALVLRSGEDDISFADPWVSTSMLLLVLIALNGTFVLGGLARRAIDKLETGGDAAAERGRLWLFGSLNNVLAVLIVYLMVAKPGA